MLLDQAWRYGIISRGARIPRSKDCFSPSDYAAFRIEGTYVPGRVLELIGDHPPIIKICMFQGRNLCSYALHSGDCDLDCRKWLFTTANHSGVLSMDDVFAIFDGSAEPLRSVDPRQILLDQQEAEKLFRLIDRLGARQKSR